MSDNLVYIVADLKKIILKEKSIVVSHFERQLCCLAKIDQFIFAMVSIYLSSGEYCKINYGESE